jgi:3-oxoacyl-(acyl-carrier-protein) synthase III
MNTAIIGTGSYLPESILSSEELGRRLGVGEQWIFEKTCIKQRRVASPAEATSDLATHAAHRALQAAGVSALDVDLLIVATSTPDQPIPATACTVQANLGAVRAAAFDVDSVCTGFVYALVTAHALLSADPGPQTALVIGADTYSRILNYEDRRTCVLFGDGAGAVVLGKRGNGRGLLSSTLSSDGTLADLVKIPGGGSRIPASAESVAAGQHYFTMYGRQVRDFANRVVPDLITDVVKSADLSLADVDLIVPHQANGTMLKSIADNLDLRPGQMHLTIERYGNTGAASVPVTLDDAVRSGLVHTDDTLVLVAFGGGMSSGAAALRWVGKKKDGDRW